MGLLRNVKKSFLRKLYYTLVGLFWGFVVLATLGVYGSLMEYRGPFWTITEAFGYIGLSLLIIIIRASVGKTNRTTSPSIAEYAVMGLLRNVKKSFLRKLYYTLVGLFWGFVVLATLGVYGSLMMYRGPFWAIMEPFGYIGLSLLIITLICKLPDPMIAIKAITAFGKTNETSSPSIAEYAMKFEGLHGEEPNWGTQRPGIPPTFG